MKKLIKEIFHIEHFVITLLAFIQMLVIGFFVFNIESLSPVANAIKNFSITDFFFRIEHSQTEQEINNFISLVDISDMKDREDIAVLLNEINENDPVLVGVDIIFEGLKLDPIANQSLIDVVGTIKDNTVFATKLTNYSSDSEMFNDSSKSFFADSVEIKEGFVNLTDNMQGSCIRDYIIKASLNGNEQLSFPAQILSELGWDFEDKMDGNFLINYSNVSFPVIKAHEVMENKDLINGRIVLVGTIWEESDMHNSPLGKMPGLMIQAYTLLTLMEHVDIKYIPLWCNWLVAFIVCLLFEILIHLAYIYINRFKNSLIMLFLRRSNIMTMIFLFILIIFLYWLLYYSYMEYNIVWNGTILLTSITLICESRDLYQAAISALRAKYNWEFLEKSIMNDD